MPFRTPVDGSKPCECLLVDHDVPPVTHEPPQRLPSLYWRSQARLPTGHPLWPARRGTCPVQVLEAQEISGSSQRVGPPGRSIMRTGQAACERYREISKLSVGVIARTASGRPEAIADDERPGEVGPAHSSWEAGERSGTNREGVSGAKGRDQRECGPAKHGPDAEPGSRVTCAGPHTRSLNQE